MRSVYILCLVALCVLSAGVAKVEGCRTDDECKDYEACVPDDDVKVCGDLWVNCQARDQCAQGETCTIRNHEVLCYQGCRVHADCPDTKLCILNHCEDPCLGMGCGANSECIVTNHTHTSCRCKPGFVKVDPRNDTAGCTDCVKDSECNDNKVCRQGRCQINVCAGKCGPNTECIVTIDNKALCTCKRWYLGHPDNKSEGCQPGGLVVKSDELKVEIQQKEAWTWVGGLKEASFSLVTREVPVELTSLQCGVWYGSLFTVKVTITSVNGSRPYTTSITHSGPSAPGTAVNITLSTEAEPVVLPAHTLYTINVSSSREFVIYSRTTSRYTGDHFDLEFPPYGDKLYTILKRIYFKTVTLA